MKAGVLCGVVAAAAGAYTVQVTRAPPDPVLSYLNGTAQYPQSFNPSYVAASPATGGKSGLLVRSQNCSDFVPGQCIGCNVDTQHPIAPWFPGSVVTFAEQRADGSFEQPYLVFAPNASAPQSEEFGTEDPRLAYDAATGLYHLFYTCYGPPGPFLCHATTTDPTAPLASSHWTRLGAVFPDLPAGTKSGALLVRESPPHYLYWGAGVIALAVSDDLVTFTTLNTSFIAARPDAFDNNLVEAGPPPLPLADGNLIFFYNSDNSTAPPSGDFGAYNPGWVILNGTDPTHILQRSDAPLLTPSYGWEKGIAPFQCNVHDVTFLEAAARVEGVAGDVFDVWFGGADAVVGTARVSVVAG